MNIQPSMHLWSGAYRGWARGSQFPGRRITMGALNHCGRHRKVSAMSQVLSSVQYICFRKTSGTNMEAQNLFLAPAPSNLVTPLPVIRRRLRQIQQSDTNVSLINELLLLCKAKG